MIRIVAAFLVVLGLGVSFFALRGQEVSVTSPVPKVFGASDDVKSNEWFPETSASANSSDVVLSARSALLVDYETGEVIFSKSPKDKLPAASTIKIMTALVALENGQPGDTYGVSQKAATVGENSMGLSEGEELRLEELLYGMMLVSGNDAAVAVAEGVAGSEDAFVAEMNRRAKELGANDTKFVNASGLDVDGVSQYSTAYDMAVISRYVWESHQLFRKTSSTFHTYIAANEKHKDYDLYNDTNLLTTYPGVKGIKPGFTWEAGLCLVTYAENDGEKLLGVILGSDDRRGEMKELLDYGFGTYGITVAHPDLDL